MTRRRARIGVLTLGCAKNLVDSEQHLGTLAREGFSVVKDHRDAEVLIVNTCSFIESARQESEDAIRDAVGLKRSGWLRGVVVVGCHAQRMGMRLKRAFPGVDAVLGISAYEGIADACRAVLAGRPQEPMRLASPTEIAFPDDARLRLTGRHTAYLRVAEGCDHTCGFCVIPRFRGRFRSKPPEKVVAEARRLARDGAREISLIAQDVTAYGTDFAGRPALDDLLRRLDEVEGVTWFRILYACPACMTERFLETFASCRRVAPYLNMPVQHLDDGMLRAMGRDGDYDRIASRVAWLRERVPGVSIRSAVIVGYPGETEAQFETMLERLEHLRFDHLRCFLFSAEPGSAAAHAPGQVPEDVKKERHERVSLLAWQLHHARARGLTGTVRDVMVDVAGPGRLWTGRSYAEGPEVDGAIRFRAPGRRLRPGRFVRVRLDGSEGQDLTGEILPARAAAGVA